jgi:hypothetical protein
MPARRFVLLAIALAALALPLGSTGAQAAWCLHARVGWAVQEFCHFRSFEACDRERAAYGTTSFCTPSQYWSGPVDGAPRPHKARKRKHRR